MKPSKSMSLAADQRVGQWSDTVSIPVPDKNKMQNPKD